MCYNKLILLMEIVFQISYGKSRVKQIYLLPIEMYNYIK